jgi:hypothetical protein
MKQLKISLITIYIIVGMISCSDSKSPAKKSEDTLIDVYQNVDKFGNKINLQQLQESIRAFHAANERYPADMEELENFSGIKLDDDKYYYDPSTGVIKYRNNDSKK